MTSFYIAETPIPLDKKSKKVLDTDNIELLLKYVTFLEKLEVWTKEKIEENIKKYCNSQNINLGMLAQPLRAAITGKSVSPGLYEVIEVLGKKETINRIKNINI